MLKLTNTEMGYGNICSMASEASSLKITWKIPEYLSLPNTSNYSLDSSPFIFANATWCLQLCPDEQSVSSFPREISISLIRLQSLMYRHKITCMFDALKQNGEYLKGEHEQEYRPLKFYADYCECESYDIKEEISGKSELVTGQEILTPEGTLVLVGHLLCEESTEEKHLQKCSSDLSTKKGETEQNSSTVSLIFSKVQSLKITWKVPKYASSLENAQGYSLNSPTLDFLHATWFLKLYPVGMEGNESDTGLSIIRSQSLVPLFHKFIYTWDIITEGDKPFNYNFYRNDKFKPFSFNEGSEMKESPKYFFDTRTMVVDCLAVDDDGNIIHGNILLQIFYEEGPVKDAAIQKLFDELNMYRTFGSDMKNFLLNGSGHDLILKVKDKEFRVHRQILSSRSPVFEAMLAHDMTENNCGVVNIPDCDPPVKEQFLLYVYCGKMDSLDETNVLGLYYAADKYDMVHLKNVCRGFIRSSLSLRNICDILRLAMTHSDEDLVEFAMEFFVKNKNEILITAKWISFMNEHGDIANEILNKTSGKASDEKQEKKKKQKASGQKRKR